MTQYQIEKHKIPNRKTQNHQQHCKLKTLGYVLSLWSNVHHLTLIVGIRRNLRSPNNTTQKIEKTLAIVMFSEKQLEIRQLHPRWRINSRTVFWSCWSLVYNEELKDVFEENQHGFSLIWLVIMGYVVKFYWLVKFATWISLIACLTVRFDLSDYKLLVSFFCQFVFITLRISCLLAKFKKGECKVWHKKFYFFHFHANKLIYTQKVLHLALFLHRKTPLFCTSKHLATSWVYQVLYIT